ncbi:Bug family tripartite tricarboxylate transporter substrate binding protein [Parapusillimonas granuli]|uniref:Tripartite tricarboxylate transporter substrate binding protein n=1 Tax=Parapusillimonas granuli TaxID=380911 RepID=A0A853G259_9BURK|nr:tripartite tricarboxylate transporter substrate binding protein [Parapusillimonas granuli]MBB5213732.1 tripartite-type tricarboxylate transporter receptor subunit TctC [Parapusillimonas granuli]NYT48566.1 tripartite tricarboxylate transporter substrate binding protein [Parapusillimonas granuli]
MMNRRRFNQFLAIAAGGGALGSLPLTVRASNWPARPVSLIIPYAPGGNTDFMARLTAEWLSRAINNSVVPENRAGAGGIIAANHVARSPSDGYTLFFATITQISLAPFLYKIQYDPFKDFVPIANVGGNPLVLTVTSASRFKSLEDLIAFGRANPGKITVGHAGVGSLSHLSAFIFLKRAGIEATLVPYKGGGPALADMLGGHTDLYSANISEIMSHASSGRVRFLGVSSLEPIPQLPGVPTIASIIPGHQIETWNGVVGPAGLPAAVVDRLAEEISRMLKDATVREKLVGAGVLPQDGQVKQAFAERIQRDVELWRPMMEQAGIKPE